MNVSTANRIKGNMNTKEKTRLLYFPHAYNYMIKEEIVQKFTWVDEAKVASLKRELKNKLSGKEESSLLAEKIIKGE